MCGYTCLFQRRPNSGFSAWRFISQISKIIHVKLMEVRRIIWKVLLPFKWENIELIMMSNHHKVLWGCGGATCFKGPILLNLSWSLVKI